MFFIYVVTVIMRKTNIKGDTSIATYRGHSVLQTLIRCHFSPQFSTGQRYIVTGCAFGRVVGMIENFFFYIISKY